MITFKCKQCKKEVKKTHLRIFCNSECYGKWLSINQKGKNSPSCIDNRSNHKYKCKNLHCNNLVGYRTKFYGKGQCRECYLKLLKTKRPHNYKGGFGNCLDCGNR